MKNLTKTLKSKKGFSVSLESVVIAALIMIIAVAVMTSIKSTGSSATTTANTKVQNAVGSTLP